MKSDKENETYFDEQNFDESLEPVEKHETDVSSTGKSEVPQCQNGSKSSEYNLSKPKKKSN